MLTPPFSTLESAGEHPDKRTGAGSGRLEPGTLLAGRYRIVCRLGRGGMGEVYRAEDLKLEQEVALKFLLGAEAAGRGRIARFLDEVKIARALSHPNLCRVFDIGEAEGRHFLSMEYVDGEDLDRLLRRVGRLPPERSRALGRRVADALASMHERGVLHGDLKPSNLMIDERGEVKITDFGLATLAGAAPSGGRAFGTPAYLAPELLAGAAPSEASDLYALGLVLYRLLTGRSAVVPAAEPPGWALRPLAELEADLDPAADRLLLACLETEAARRPSARRLERALAPEKSSLLASWRPEEGAEVPGRPHWTLAEKLEAGGFGEAWLAAHEKSREHRVFKFCFDPARLPALRREVTVWRLLRESLGEREDINRILDWHLEEPPYFLESDYTAGGSLVDWARRRGGLAAVPLATRLELLAQVAEALGAAHAIGVLHKDVKPANVLVREREGATPQVRLADFGLGAVLERERLAAAGITVAGLTEAGGASSHEGTRLYMAPELLEGKPATVESDLYALGVMLYQLVVGDLSRALAPGWERQVEDDLLRTDLAEAVAGDPEERTAGARGLARRLRALPERRQQREQEARRRREAEAARASLARTRRRLRWAGTAAALLVLAAAALAFHSRRVAREAEGTRRMLDFMVGLFQPPEADKAVPETLTVREMLDRGAARIGPDFEDRPEIGARLDHTLGMAYHTLGLRARGAELLGRALETRILLDGEDSPEVADLGHDLAALLNEIGRSEEAEPLIRRALATRLRVHGAESLPVADSQQVLAGVLFYLGRHREAGRLYEEVLAKYRRLHLPGHVDTAIATRHLGMVHSRLGELEEARRRLEESLALFESLYPEGHTETALNLMGLGLALHRLGELDGAEGRFREALAMKQQLIGEDHPDTAAFLTYLGFLLKARGRNGEARDLLARALRFHTDRFGDKSPSARQLTYALQELEDSQSPRTRGPLPRKNVEETEETESEQGNPAFPSSPSARYGLGRKL